MKKIVGMLLLILLAHGATLLVAHDVPTKKTQKIKDQIEKLDKYVGDCQAYMEKNPISDNVPESVQEYIQKHQSVYNEKVKNLNKLQEMILGMKEGGEKVDNLLAQAEKLEKEFGAVNVYIEKVNKVKEESPEDLLEKQKINKKTDQKKVQENTSSSHQNLLVLVPSIEQVANSIAMLDPNAENFKKECENISRRLMNIRDQNSANDAVLNRCQEFASKLAILQGKNAQVFYLPEVLPPVSKGVIAGFLGLFVTTASEAWKTRNFVEIGSAMKALFINLKNTDALLKTAVQESKPVVQEMAKTTKETVSQVVQDPKKAFLGVKNYVTHVENYKSLGKKFFSKTGLFGVVAVGTYFVYGKFFKKNAKPVVVKDVVVATSGSDTMYNMFYVILLLLGLLLLGFWVMSSKKRKK